MCDMHKGYNVERNEQDLLQLYIRFNEAQKGHQLSQRPAEADERRCGHAFRVYRFRALLVNIGRLDLEESTGTKLVIISQTDCFHLLAKSSARMTE